MSNQKGTPHSLIETIERALDDNASPELFRARIQDFLSQKFGAVMLAASDDEAMRIKRLFEKCTK